MKEVLITFAEKPHGDYPLAVVVMDNAPDAIHKRGQETTCRSMRDARLYANGVCAGGRAAGIKDWPINPVIDPRLILE